MKKMSVIILSIKTYELASRLSVEGTPTIFLEDGRIIPGYQNYKNILSFINQ